MASRYQIVCMVVDRGSLKGAADELGYTQSAVSQAVKALERELGTTLIERGKQGVSLTRDGKQYRMQSPKVANHARQYGAAHVSKRRDTNISRGESQ